MATVTKLRIGNGCVFHPEKSLIILNDLVELSCEDNGSQFLIVFELDLKTEIQELIWFYDDEKERDFDYQIIVNYFLGE